MKVLLVSIWKPKKGGIVTHVDNIIKRSKNRFTILTYRDKGAKKESNVLRVLYIDFPILRGLSYALFSFIRGVRADFDIIHAHYAIPQGFVGVLIKTVRRKSLLLTVHGSDLTVLGGSPWLKPLLKWIFKRCNRIIAVSYYMKGLLIDLGVREEKITVIYNGVNKQSLAIGSERRIVFIGALVKQKGVEILLKAFKEIKKTHPDVRLVVVGDGPERENLEEMSRLQRLKDVEFKGYVDDLDTFFTANTVFVLPSIKEGFGITILEAMARGVPVAASKTGGIPELIVDGENGLFFTKDNSTSLTDAVRRIFDDEAQREKLIKGGWKTISKFTWNKTSEETEDVYKEFAGEGIRA
jgi:glycosyltransferase involved in cell wall biosynthesis